MFAVQQTMDIRNQLTSLVAVLRHFPVGRKQSEIEKTKNKGNNFMMREKNKMKTRKTRRHAYIIMCIVFFYCLFEFSVLSHTAFYCPTKK